MTDQTMTITFAPKYEGADADGLMEALLDRSGSLGPVVDIDVTGALSVTVGFESQKDFAAMISTHLRVIGAAMDTAGVAAHELVDFHLSTADTRKAELRP